MPMENFFQTTLDDYEAFEQLSWNRGEGWKLPSFPMIEKNLEGMMQGLYLLAAESNVGKSAAMMNILYDVCSHPENKMFGIYYSLDDGKFEIMPRVVAMMQSIPISVVSKPKRYQNHIEDGGELTSLYTEYLRKMRSGMAALKELNGKFKVEDGSKIKCAEDLYQHMVNLQIYVKSIDPEMNIIVAIDSINDIRFRDRHFSNAQDKHGEVARMVKEWTVELGIPILASCHLRKLNQNRRPTLDDLKESVEYVYESSLVWLLYSDVGKNKQSAKIYYTAEGNSIKQPVIEFDWAKNKLSSYKGRSYCYFAPQYSKAMECDEEAANTFDSSIYEN